MEIKLKIDYQQLVAIINQLPADEVNKLKAEIERVSNKNNFESDNDLESYIANGPVMNDEKYQDFIANRENFNQWRKS